MDKGLKIDNKIVISLVTLLLTIFFTAFFLIYFIHGNYPYEYRIIQLISSILIILFAISNIIIQSKNHNRLSKMILITISILLILTASICIYYYFDTPEKYIKRVNIGSIILINSYVLSCVYILCDKLWESKEENILAKINKPIVITIIIMIAFLFLTITTNPKSYNLNYILAFIVFISYTVVVCNWNIKLKVINDILVFISIISFFGSSIYFAKHFDTIEQYILSTFLNSFAIIPLIIAITLSFAKDDSFVNKIVNLFLLIILVILFNSFRIDDAKQIDEMNKINIYRIITVFVVYLIIIRDHLNNIITKNNISCIFSGITLVTGLVLSIITINKMNELYYIFFEKLEISSMIALILYIINVGLKIFYNNQLQKNQNN